MKLTWKMAHWTGSWHEGSFFLNFTHPDDEPFELFMDDGPGQASRPLAPLERQPNPVGWVRIPQGGCFVTFAGHDKKQIL